MGSPSGRVPLNYSPPPPPPPPGRWPRWIALIIVGIALGGGACWLINRYVEQAIVQARRQAVVARAQQQAAAASGAKSRQFQLEAFAAWQRCAKLVADPNLVVYENRDGISVPRRGNDESEDLAFATSSGVGVRLPSELNVLLRRLDFDPASRPGPLLYIGLRQRPAGNSTASEQELVVVEMSSGTDLLPGPDNGTISFAVTTFTSAGTTGVNARTLNVPSIPVIRPRDFLRLYAGEFDPSDQSHFTIRYEVRSGSGLIDGWLQGDGTVRIEVSGPIHP